MSLSLWRELPDGLLRMKYPRWKRLPRDVQPLIVELAARQNFTCAFCKRARGLEVEHDHAPEEGAGDVYTIYNIRGLVCRSCNWHLGMHEAEQRGEYVTWENFDCKISDHDYGTYVCAYEHRVRPLIETLLEQRFGTLIYWRRRIVLQKFDDWKEWDEEYPWRWGFEEIKAKRYGRVRTPRQAILALSACMQFVLAEIKKNPNYEPPDAFFELMVRVKPWMDKIRPLVEARMKFVGTDQPVNGLS